MAKRFKNNGVRAARRNDQTAAAAFAAPSWDEAASGVVSDGEVSNVFGGDAPVVSQKKPVPVLVTMWALAENINPDVFQNEPLNTLVNEGDGHGAWDELLYRSDLPWGTLRSQDNTADIKKHLEFAMIVEQHVSEKKKKDQQTFCDFSTSTDVKEIVDMLRQDGFDLAYSENFSSQRWDDCKNETFYVFFHRKLGVLIYFDTYQGRLNGGKIHLQYTCSEPNPPNIDGGRSTEYFDGKTVYNVDYDVRDGWRQKYHRLKQIKGIKFLEKWVPSVYRPFLLHWGDKEKLDQTKTPATAKKGEKTWYEVSDDMIDAKVQKLPKYVRDCIVAKEKEK